MIELAETNRGPLLLAMAFGGFLAILVALIPGVPLGIGLLAAGATGLAFFNRRAALYVIPFAIALTPEIPVLGIPLRIEDLIIIPVAAGWLAHAAVFKDRERTTLDRLLLAYLLVAFVATLWGGYLGTVRLLAISKDYGSLFHLLKRLEFVVLFFIVADTLTSAREVQGMTYVVMAALLGLTIFGFTSYLSNPTLDVSNQTAAVAPIAPVDPGHEPGIASMINVALALSLLPAARGFLKSVLVALILFSLVALPSTLGRNYIATTAIIMLYIGLFHQRWVLWFFPVAWLVSLSRYPADIVGHVLTLQHVFAPNVPGEGASLATRAAPLTYFGALGLGYSPVLGFGLASRDLGAFDSEYITQLFYTGLAGLGIFLLLGARLFRVTREIKEAAREPLNAALARGFQLIWVAYAIHSVFSPSISSTRAGEIFFFAAGLLAVLHKSTVGSNAPASSS